VSAAAGAAAVQAPTPDAGAVPDVDAAGIESGDGPSLEDMAAIMDESGGETPAAPAPVAPPVKGPATPPAVAAAPKAPEELPGEEPPAPAVDVAKEADKLRKGWAALARDKEQLVAKAQQLTSEIERVKAYENKAKFLDTLPEKIAANPIAFLEANGVSVDDLLNRVIEAEKSPVEREIAQLRAEREAEKKRAADEQKNAAARAEQEKNQRIIQEWQQRNTSFASTNPDRYDMIVALEQGEAVHQTCLAYHAKHGVILDPATAADYVEKGLRAGIQKSKYLKGLLASSQPKAPVPAPKPAQPSSTPKVAPKQTGSTVTLSSVATGDSAPSANDLPADSDARMEAVLREMHAAGELPDQWRVG
jgi:hypothetical protein